MSDWWLLLQLSSESTRKTAHEYAWRVNNRDQMWAERNWGYKRWEKGQPFLKQLPMLIAGLFPLNDLYHQSAPRQHSKNFLKCSHEFPDQRGENLISSCPVELGRYQPLSYTSPSSNEMQNRVQWNHSCQIGIPMRGLRLMNITRIYERLFQKQLS